MDIQFQMANEWLDYIKKLDALVLEALRACARNSLQNVFNTLHGDGNLGPTPLINIYLDLNETKVLLRMNPKSP